jgi:hypothetical protein
MNDSRQQARILCNDRQLAGTLRELLGGQVAAEQVLCEAGDCSDAPLCRWLGEAQLGQLGRVQAALVEVVEILQSTRHAFKSREVGRARRRLSELMAELSGPQ